MWHCEHAGLVGMGGPSGEINSQMGDHWHFSIKDGGRNRVSSP